ncbi:DUF4825 domain-containing protein [Heliobacterium chlorum]|uniref:DUF4825 domain-containing protein n=1 Tax=Heliobacterium chlorum TaxID=2698 RepID=A0ABR7T747_HELCL|nr:DUF4825 domain-containing protein [Heliobacterium chlorum]MBC9786589.1 DUF4825 domain-containing protein [Heliobacterium chlorum]
MTGLFTINLRMKRITGLIAFLGLCIGLLIYGLSDNDSPSSSVSYIAKSLWQYKTTYVGNNSKVVNLLSHLPFGDLRREVSLQTQQSPYGVTVQYDFSKLAMEKTQIEPILYNNAITIFALIGNADQLTFKVQRTDTPSEYRYTRADIQQALNKDLRDYTKDLSSFENLLEQLNYTGNLSY